MIAFINGNIVEGTLEEIAKLLGIKLEDSSYAPTVTNTDHIPAQSCRVSNPQWLSGQRELERNKGKLVKGEENSGS